MKFRRYAIITFIPCFIVGCVILTNYYGSRAGTFHTDVEMEFFESHLSSTFAPGDFFHHSIECKGCHGFDSLHVASVDSNGNDINLYDDWEGTMMANSAVDPFWRAKISHEILVNPAHDAELQHKCTSCHAPMGHYNAFFKGITQYSLAMLDADSLGKNGVSCSGCHMIGTNNLGNVFSGEIPYDTTKKEFGPFQNPVAGPMQLYVDITPTFSQHVSESRFCSPCHTLMVNTTDLAGNLTGETFPEQATYHEWINSTFPADNITCQQCHMPETNDSIIIANNIANLPPRAPFNMHEFTGANSFMVKLIKDNKASLNVTTDDSRFDSTLAAITRFLQKNTLGIDLSLENLTGDTAFISLRLTNRAGHKFPSGYPSRRAVVQFIALDQSGDTVFSSGLFDPNFEVVNIDTTYEPHYNVIDREDQVQIYEMIMGDVNDVKTTVLARADTFLKDNRLVPEGFLSTSPVYDTVAIFGEALTDPDFNKDLSGNEGTGRDFIHYHIPVTGISGTITFYANVYYQTVPPGWLHEMFSYNSADIDTFRNMYQSADKSPFLIGTDSLHLLTLRINTLNEEAIRIFPNPVSDGKIFIQLSPTTSADRIELFTIDGKRVKTLNFAKSPPFIEIEIPGKGVYLISITSGKKRFIRKVVSD